jgi:acetyl-CoA carboxylase biotin carboxyl carrier protein
VSTPRRRNPAKKRQGRPIVLPQSFAPRAFEADQPILGPEQANQIQTLVDLLKRNHLTELEIERAGSESECVMSRELDRFWHMVPSYLRFP